MWRRWYCVRSDSSDGSGQVSAEPVLGVGPGGFDRKAGAAQRVADARDDVLIAVLGVDALALLEWDFEANQFDLRGLVERALQVHLDARTIRIPQCNVAKEIEIE